MLTVLLATRNGDRTLPRTLDALCRLQRPVGGWQLVVVDNGSTDATATIVMRYEKTLPLTYVYEGRAAKSAAVNTGIRHIKGDLVVFMDDDIIPCDAWLVHYRDCADRHPEYHVFGGPIVPHWETPPKGWMLDQIPLTACYGLTDPAVKEGPVSCATIYGGNMAVRSNIYDLGYRLDENIGPIGRAAGTMGEETDFLMRISQSGMRSWYCESARVEHIIRDFQISEKWIRNRARLYGAGSVAMEAKKWPSSPPTVLGFPRYLVRKFVTQLGRYGVARLASNPRKSKEEWQVNFRLGQLLGSRAIVKERSRKGSSSKTR